MMIKAFSRHSSIPLLWAVPFHRANSLSPAFHPCGQYRCDAIAPCVSRWTQSWLLRSHHGNLCPYTVPDTRNRRTRLFGSDPTTSSSPGEINLSDDRDLALIPIDLFRLQATLEATRELMGYSTYDVSLTLVDEDYMRQINMETRGVDSSTDVLSFPMNGASEPGVLEVPQHGKLIGDYYCLGDLVICVDYVAKRCQEDKVNTEREGGEVTEIAESDVFKETSKGENVECEQDHDMEMLDEWDDRGVAPALLTTYNPEIRIHMLIVHGMLHLVGYDHIEDDDYELMVEKEDKIMFDLKQKFGQDFGFGRSSGGNTIVGGGGM